MTQGCTKKKVEPPKTTVSTFRTQDQTPRKSLIYTGNKRQGSLWPAGVKGRSDFLRRCRWFAQSSPRITKCNWTNKKTIWELKCHEARPQVLRKFKNDILDSIVYAFFIVCIWNVETLRSKSKFRWTYYNFKHHITALAFITTWLLHNIVNDHKRTEQWASVAPLISTFSRK